MGNITDIIQTVAASMTILGYFIAVIPQPQSEMDRLGLYLLVGFAVFCGAILLVFYMS